MRKHNLFQSFLLIVDLVLSHGGYFWDQVEGSFFGKSEEMHWWLISERQPIEMHMVDHAWPMVGRNIDFGQGDLWRRHFEPQKESSWQCWFLLIAYFPKQNLAVDESGEKTEQGRPLSQSITAEKKTNHCFIPSSFLIHFHRMAVIDYSSSFQNSLMAAAAAYCFQVY